MLFSKLVSYICNDLVKQEELFKTLWCLSERGEKIEACTFDLATGLKISPVFLARIGCVMATNQKSDARAIPDVTRPPVSPGHLCQVTLVCELLDCKNRPVRLVYITLIGSLRTIVHSIQSSSICLKDS